MTFSAGGGRGRYGRRFAPLYRPGVAPEAVEVVVASRVLAEDVQDDVDEVDARPARAVVADARERLEILFLTGLLDLVADRLHLPRAGAGGDHEEIGHGGH